ncbi:HDIG domain-containing metalloprotein [Natranaerobius thermophilus]|uniref:Metal dependent phosphohydrolase n=1 Tax=Natranaerobius thermophilus (strain ATCC BAA-1301 / DSM 18059 / JW/NM-WN-LF) TaxID=457570 RepID=B2A6Y7_NATTJ|nr:HDIG domain-containing metalloprotein [Natranaerobius thermophilus]ACB85578.1 metal dependent phosphohydrolase [Natranaerobius thermophilus JW/NM-WN-LF]
MNREEACNLLKDKVKTDNLVKHSLAVSKVMERMAEKLDEDKDKWELVGLLHDIDYEETKDNPENHSLKGAEMLKEKGFDQEFCEAVKRHNDAHGLARESNMDKALYCADPVTGLIVASALIHPDKSLKSIDEEFIMNRYEEPSFARGAKRSQIAMCHELGFELEEFIGLALGAMQDISDDLGL